VEDSAYQYLNFFVPEGAGKGSAILMRTYVGGYMASAAGYPQAGDATGRALKEGIVVCIPGTRGRNSTVTDNRGHTVYTGRAPKAILDLKAAVRYLRHFDRQMLGTAERIFIDGTSAGGALAALLGTSGNQADYADELRAMGAADERDEVFGAICFCPITDLDHADMAYEWLYNGTDSRRAASASIRKMSAELAAQYPAYLESLQLRTPNGTLLTRDNYLDYVKSEIIRGAQYAKDAGADIPDGIGFSFSPAASFGAPPVNGGTNAQASTRRKRPAGGADIPEEERPARSQQQKERGEYIIDLDMPTYLNYVVGTIALKTAPAFDSEIKTGIHPESQRRERRIRPRRRLFRQFHRLHCRAERQPRERRSAPQRAHAQSDELHFFHVHHRALLVHSPRRPRPRHVVLRAHQSRAQAPKRRQKRQLPPRVEPSAQRRLRPRRNLRLDEKSREQSLTPPPQKNLPHSSQSGGEPLIKSIVKNLLTFYSLNVYSL